MNLNDYKGKRGRVYFIVLISTWCDGSPLFNERFLGEKHETTDFLVELVNPTSGHAQFDVQVKATGANYIGKGSNRKIVAPVSRTDVSKLKRYRTPTCIVGIDIDNVRGYIKAVTQNVTGGISGISTKHILTCRNLRLLWKEVDDYWQQGKRAIHYITF